MDSKPYFPLEESLSNLLGAVPALELVPHNGGLADARRLTCSEVVKVATSELKSRSVRARSLREVSAASSGETIAGKPVRRAAVAIILRPTAQDSKETEAPVELLLLKRAVRRGDPWSGNVCLPGGHVDPGETLTEACMRETQEETGIDLAGLGARLVGRLDDRKATGTSKVIIVSAFVFALPRECDPPVTLQASEIAGYRWVPLAALAEEQNATWHELHISTWVKSRTLVTMFKAIGFGKILFPGIRLPVPAERESPAAASSSGDDPDREHDFVLWGLTLTMISDLLAASRLPAVKIAGGKQLAHSKPQRSSETALTLPVGARHIAQPRVGVAFWNPALHVMLYGWRTHGIPPGTALLVGMALNVGAAALPVTLGMRWRASL